MLGEVEARGAKVDARVAEVKVKAKVVEEALGKVMDQALATEEEAHVGKVQACKVAMEVVEAFKAGEEYCLEVLKASRDAFQQSFEFFKGQVTILLLNIDVGKLRMELSLDSG